MSLTFYLLLIQWLGALFMSGVIVFVQIVHYPLFAEIGDENFSQYSQQHQRRTTWVVGPPMLTEAVALVCLWLADRSLASHPAMFVATLLLIVIWISTAAVQMPLHAQLLNGKSTVKITKLVASNWIRTVAWPTRAALLGGLLLHELPSLA